MPNSYQADRMLLRLQAYNEILHKQKPTLEVWTALTNLYNDFKVTLLWYTERAAYLWKNLI